jgi:hypothetical protein
MTSSWNVAQNSSPHHLQQSIRSISPNSTALAHEGEVRSGLFEETIEGKPAELTAASPKRYRGFWRFINSAEEETQVQVRK